MLKKILFSFLIFPLVLGFTSLSSAEAFFGKKVQPAIQAEPISEPLTLAQAFEMALVRSEEIGMKKEFIEAAQAHFYQSLSSVLPSVNFHAGHFRQDSDEEAASEDGSSRNFTRETSDDAYFSLTQPLFGGFKDIAAIKASGMEKSQRRFELERARQLLFQSVMEAFYGMLQAQKDLEILEKTQGLMGDRIKELEGRLKLGRSRESEMLTSTVDYKVVIADTEEARRVEGVWKELLEFYIGREIAGGLVDEESPNREMNTIEAHLEAVDGRADVRASRENKMLMDQKVVVARGGLFPKVGIDANYYTKREGFVENVDWDVLLRIDVPIFEGTKVWGDIKLAAADQKSAELLLSQTQRLASMDVRNSHRNYLSLKAQEDALKEAAEASNKNYNTLTEEYRLSLVNNLQVLDSLRQYQEIQRRYNQVRYESRRNFWRLMVAIGETQ